MPPDFDKELTKAIGYFGERYGKPDTEFRRLPVATHDKYFAQTLVDEKNKTISVKLAATTKLAQIKYQLWHEAVHCLAPVQRMDTLWFEEGLAVHSALNAPHMKQAYKSECIAELRSRPIWYGPWQSFKKLNATLPQIKRIHESAPQRRFDNITPSLIIEVFTACPALAHELCQRLPFNR
jgi:hypothetical protein